jgi:MFS family permease
VLAIGLNDELWSGVAVVAAPAVEAEQRLSHGGYTLLVFVVPLLIASVLEACLSVLSDRVPRRWLIAASLAVLAASLFACALASSGYALSVALGLAGTASGVACAAAQAELVAANPEGAERALTRWTLFGAVGDVLTPLLIGVLFAFGGSYRLALAIVAVATLCQALAVARSAWAPSAPPAAVTSTEEAEDESVWQALRTGASNRQLWLWLFGAAVCTLLDEIVIALATLRIEQDLGHGRVSATACATLISLGSVAGAYATERLLARFDSTRLLALSAVGCAAALSGVAFAHSLEALVPLLFALGFSCAPHFALLHARAFAALPGRPGVVNAIGEVFVVLDVAAPYAVGVVADRFGLGVALLVLLLQPATVLLLTLLVRRRSPRPT